MKISIATPSFNHGKYIKKCVDSIVNQNGNFLIEHIVFDNCSTDETKKHLAFYKEKNTNIEIKCFFEKDNGQTNAINKCFHLSGGDIVCWLNADEYYNAGALSSVAEFFSTHPDVDILFGDCTFVDTNGHVVKEKKEYGFNKNMLIYYGCFIPSCATFIRRRVLDLGYYLDESYRVCMDFEWYTRLADAGFKFAHLSVGFANFTWHATNISSTFVKKRIEERHQVQLKYGGG